MTDANNANTNSEREMPKGVDLIMHAQALLRDLDVIVTEMVTSENEPPKDRQYTRLIALREIARDCEAFFENMLHLTGLCSKHYLTAVIRLNEDVDPVQQVQELMGRLATIRVNAGYTIMPERASEIRAERGRDEDGEIDISEQDTVILPTITPINN